MTVSEAIVYGIDLALVASTIVLAIARLRRIRANRKRGLPWSPIAKLRDRKP